MFLPNAIVLHQGSAIVRPDSYFQTYHGNRNQIWCLIKNMPFYLLVFALPAHICLFAFSYMRNKDRLPNRGMIDGFWAGLGRGWKLRVSRLFKRTSIKPPAIKFYQSLAWNPYLFIQNGLHFGSTKPPSA